MCGSRKLCQRGSNFDGFCFYLLVDEGREIPSTTISGPSSPLNGVSLACRYGQTLNDGLVAL